MHLVVIQKLMCSRNYRILFDFIAIALLLYMFSECKSKKGLELSNYKVLLHKNRVSQFLKDAVIITLIAIIKGIIMTVAKMGTENCNRIQSHCIYYC